MSFASMPLYTGDYLRDTRHLTPLRHGVYLLALMHCWDSQGPMPIDEQECSGICNCRSADEVDALRYVLDRYFVRMDDGWYNKRMTEEVARWEKVSKARSDGGLKSAITRRNKARIGARRKIEDKLNLSSTQAEHKSVSPSLSPSLSKKEENPEIHTRFSAREYLSRKGVSDQFISDYLAIRRAKKLTPTIAAMEKIEKEAERAGMTFAQAIETCCANSWAGFKADWCSSSGEINYATLGD